MANVTAIVVAAGKGTRMERAENKVFLPLMDKPILEHTLEKLEYCELVDEVILVTAESEQQRCRQQILKKQCLNKVTAVIPGGLRRQDSVNAGLQAINTNPKLVVVHDGARPLFTTNLLQDCIKKANNTGAAIAAVRVKDTIKVADNSGIVHSTPDRENLWAVQTPQVFDYQMLCRAYEYGYSKGLEVTDDASLLEKMGVKVLIVPGEYENIKITTPEDLLLAEAILNRKMKQG